MNCELLPEDNTDNKEYMYLYNVKVYRKHFDDELFDTVYIQEFVNKGQIYAESSKDEI